MNYPLSADISVATAATTVAAVRTMFSQKVFLASLSVEHGFVFIVKNHVPTTLF
jgi:hypothetical protein